MRVERRPGAVRCMNHGEDIDRADGPAAWHDFFVRHVRCFLVATILRHRLQAVAS